MANGFVSENPCIFKKGYGRFVKKIQGLNERCINMYEKT